MRDEEPPPSHSLSVHLPKLGRRKPSTARVCPWFCIERFFINTTLSDFRLSPLTFLCVQSLAGKAGRGLSSRHTQPSLKMDSLEWTFISLPLQGRRHPSSLLLPLSPEIEAAWGAAFSKVNQLLPEEGRAGKVRPRCQHDHPKVLT